MFIKIHFNYQGELLGRTNPGRMCNSRSPYYLFAGPLRGGGVSRDGAPGHMSLGGPQAKTSEKNRGCTLSKANKIKCVLS